MGFLESLVAAQIVDSLLRGVEERGLVLQHSLPDQPLQVVPDHVEVEVSLIHDPRLAGSVEGCLQDVGGYVEVVSSHVSSYLGATIKNKGIMEQ